jgi:hypothetical protein
MNLPEEKKNPRKSPATSASFLEGLITFAEIYGAVLTSALLAFRFGAFVRRSTRSIRSNFHAGAPVLRAVEPGSCRLSSGLSFAGAVFHGPEKIV